MTEFRTNGIETAEAALKLGAFQDETVNPRVVEFAHYLSGRLYDRLVPSGFIMASTLALYDLQAGVDGFTSAPIENSLVGLSNSEHDELLASVPGLARAAFPEDFADEVLNNMVQMGILPPPEAGESVTLDEGEIITELIDNIEDAHFKIVEDAKKRTSQLDWQRFGITDEDVTTIFDASYLLVLRNSPFVAPINVLLDKREHEAGLLQELLPQQKMQIRDKYWLALMTDAIPSELAMVVRDNIFLKSIETIASLNEIDPEEAISYFARDIDGPVRRATVRLHTAMNENPQFLRR